MTAPIILTTYVRARDDLEVAYRKWGHEKLQDTPIVAVHGNWGTSASWTLLAAELTERRVFAPDLRGCGLTRGPDHGYTIPELADDLLGFLDGMELTRVHLLGHALGAAVAAELATRAPGRIATLTLVSPPWVDGMPEALADHELQQALKTDSRSFSRAQAALAPQGPRDMLWVGLIEAGYKQRLAAATGTLDALVAWQPSDTLASLPMPRRVVDGEHDSLMGGEVAARAAAALACSRMTLTEIGHSPALEAPEPLAELIRAMIAEVEGIRI